MKNNIIILSILAIFATSAASAQEALERGFFSPAESIAQLLVATFDTDQSDALNKLELSAAVDYLSSSRPLLTNSLDYTTGTGEISAPPKIAYALVVGFDSDEDVQLTEEELTLAISYLRRLNRGSNTFFAMRD